MPHQATVIRLCGLSVAWGLSVSLWHLCYWYHSLSHFSCLGEAQASKFCPADSVLLSTALNINTCLWGLINTQYREAAKKERTKHRISLHVHEDGNWGAAGKEKKWKIDINVKVYEKATAGCQMIVHLLAAVVGCDFRANILSFYNQNRVKFHNLLSFHHELMILFMFTKH